MNFLAVNFLAVNRHNGEFPRKDLLYGEVPQRCISTPLIAPEVNCIALNCLVVSFSSSELPQVNYNEYSEVNYSGEFPRGDFSRG
jgi:hypothetical protein